VLDIELPDFDAMREQINSVHQGPAWFRATVPATFEIACDSIAVQADLYIGGSRVAVALCPDDGAVAVFSLNDAGVEFRQDVYGQVQRQIDKQKKCNAENNRHRQGCFC
jgi:hypothetical protein